MRVKTFYNSDGKIVASFSGDLSIVDFSDWDQYSSIEDPANENEHWISEGVVLDRLPNPATLLGFTISNIPCNGKLTIDGNEYEVTESTVDLELPFGTYQITLDCFPYLPKSFEVTV